MSVARPQVIWQGAASEATDRNNHVLASYLKETVNGCADFLAVLRSVKRELRYAPAPLMELVFFSSLVHTGGRDSTPDGCAVDPDNLPPPEEFFSELADVQADTQAALKFHWTYDEVAPVVADYFDEKGIRVEVLQEKRTMVELFQ